jgi:hypothetical protein
LFAFAGIQTAPETDRDSTRPSISKELFTHFEQRNFSLSNFHRNTWHKQIGVELFQEHGDPHSDLCNGTNCIGLTLSEQINFSP